jgi:ATP adenylyltransferase
MERLFSPWRSQYIESFAHASESKNDCIFCTALAGTKDEDHSIVHRGRECFVIMNLYPYNSGHLMIVPNRHIPSPVDITDSESTEIFALIRSMIRALQEVSHPDGFNIGANIGRIAGAGIDQHVHFHLVPRWSGDTNFMPVLNDTKLISEDMNVLYKKLRAFVRKGH